MADLAALTLEGFRHRTGETFHIRTDDTSGPALALTEVEPLGDASAPELRSPFSLIFHGPPEPVLSQRIQALEHPELGRLEIFLVPIGPDASGQRYQAIFS